MWPYLSAGQWRDWVLLHNKYNLAPVRDDIHWALARADFINANLAAGELEVRPCDVSPYLPDPLEEDITREALLARMGLGRLFGRKG